MADDFFAVARRQRAHRRFGPGDVPDALVARVLEAAVGAPSAGNRQPWEFVVVRDPGARAAIAGLAAEVWSGGARAFSERHLPPGMVADVDAGATGGLGSAPVLVVVCADTDRALEPDVGPSLWPAVQNLLLAATAVGLGSALTTLATLRTGELAGHLGLPASVRPMAVVPLGWPARALGAPRRDPAADHTHRERYGARW